VAFNTKILPVAVFFYFTGLLLIVKEKCNARIIELTQLAGEYGEIGE
jgi:hypothetical protein